MRLDYIEIKQILANRFSVDLGSVSLSSEVEASIVLEENFKMNVGNLPREKYGDEITGSPKGICYVERTAIPVKHTMSALDNEEWVECTCCGSSNRLSFVGKHPNYCSNCGCRFIYGKN